MKEASHRYGLPLFLYFDLLIDYTMRYVTPVLFLLAITTFSCNKDKDFKSAVVIDTGDISTNGCGYLLKMDDNSQQRPINLPSAFQHDGLKVKVKYHSKDSVIFCNAVDTTYTLPTVVVDDIKRDL